MERYDVLVGRGSCGLPTVWAVLRDRPATRLPLVEKNPYSRRT